MRRVGLIVAAIVVLLGLIAVALRPGAAPKVNLSVSPLGPSPDGTARFMVGVTNNSSGTLEVLVGRAFGPTGVVDEQRAVLPPMSGSLVAVPVPGGTSPWTLAVFHRRRDSRVESILRGAGWRLGLCQASSPDFAQWKKIQIEIPGQPTNGLSQ